MRFIEEMKKKGRSFRRLKKQKVAMTNWDLRKDHFFYIYVIFHDTFYVYVFIFMFLGLDFYVFISEFILNHRRKIKITRT
jgi:hypothetical protein